MNDKFENFLTAVIFLTCGIPFALGVASHLGGPLAFCLTGFAISFSWLVLRIAGDHLWHRRNLSLLNKVEDGWFNGEGKRPSDLALDKLQNVLPLFNGREVDVCPRIDGGILIYDKRTAIKLAILITPSGEMRVAREDERFD